MRNGITRRLAPIVVVAIGVAAAAGLTSYSGRVRMLAGATSGQPRAVAVDAITQVCPALGLPGAPVSDLALFTAAGQHPSGEAQVTRLGRATRAPLVTVTRPGRLAVTRVHPVLGSRRAVFPATHGGQVATVPAQGGAVVQATGALAGGLEAEQVSTDGRTADRCVSPGTNFWFTGPGEQSVHHITLYLMNVGNVTADVSVTAFTDAGPVQGVPDNGVSVAPHSMVAQSLDGALRGSRVVALQVQTNVGQVAAAVDEQGGANAAGLWLPSAQPPADQVVIPGMPSTPGTPQVIVAVPGAAGARVTVSAVTPKGTFVPTGGGGVEVPGGSAAEIPLGSLGGTPGALAISANEPITASVLLVGGHGTSGVLSAATPSVQEQGVVDANSDGGGNISELVLAAPDASASVLVTRIGAGGAARAASKTVRIPAHRAIIVALSKPPGTPAHTPYAVVVSPQPGSGPVFGARVLTHAGKNGQLESVLPFTSALTAVPLPPVRGTVISSG